MYNNTSKCKFRPLTRIYSKELNLIIKELLQIKNINYNNNNNNNKNNNIFNTSPNNNSIN